MAARDPFDPIYGKAADPFDAGYDYEPAGFSGLFEELGSMLSGFPTHVKAGVARYMEGLDPKKIFSEQDWKDKAIAEAERLTQEELARPAGEQPIIGPLKRRHFRETAPSLGFSATTMGAGLAAGVGAGLSMSPLAGYAAGATVSGHAAFSQAGNEFMRRAVGMAADAYQEETGEEMTPEQQVALGEKFAPNAQRYGLWEAVPEAASNVVGFKILAAPLKQLFGESVTARFLGKAGAFYGEELLTEVITQIGQHNVEVEADMTDEERRSFMELRDWGTSLAEVAPATLIQATLMGGTVKAGIGAYRMAAGTPEQEAEAEAETREQIALQQRMDQKETLDAAIEEADRYVDQGWEAPPSEVYEGEIRPQITPETIPEPETAEIVPEPEMPETIPEPEIPPEIPPEVPPEIPPAEAPAISPAKEEVAPLPTEELTGRERIARKKAEVDAASTEAATSPANELPEPTDAQIEAENYKKGHVRLHGFEVSIENAKGSTRRAKPGAEEQWEQEMAHDYGYLRGTVGRDKDHLDVFLGEKAADESLPVFIVDQVDPDTRAFDEHKVVFGAESKLEAGQIYLANYPDDWGGLSNVTKMSQEQFKAWATDPEMTSRRADGFVDREPTDEELARLEEPETDWRGHMTWAWTTVRDRDGLNPGSDEELAARDEFTLGVISYLKGEPLTYEMSKDKTHFFNMGWEHARSAERLGFEAPGEEELDAAKIRIDERQVQRRRTQRKRGQRKGRKDLQQPAEAGPEARDEEEAREEEAKPPLRERPRKPEVFLAGLPAETVIEAETGQEVEVTGAEAAQYAGYNQRIDALKQVLDCIG